MSVKLLFLAGSARTDSVNKKLARAACEIARVQGAAATFIDLADYPMPIYDGDLDAAGGLPDTANKLKALFAEHDGVFIASPEYNSSFSPLLKNALDWISRKSSDDEPSLIAYKGKVFALGAASPGGYGGLRGLVPLRMMLGNMGVLVLPEQLAVSSAYDYFDDAGDLTHDGHKGALGKLVARLIEVTGKTR